MTSVPLIVPGKPQETVLNLMRQKRFFLAEDHKLDSCTFEEAIVLDRRVSDLYKDRQLDWTRSILAEEAAFGMLPPVLGKEQFIVKCSRYTGGLDIVSVLSMQTLWHFIPPTAECLHNDLFALLHGNKDDIRPRELPMLEAETRILSDSMMKQFAELEQESSVLILRTRFDATREDGLRTIWHRLKDYAGQNVALAYLLYQNEQFSPMIHHGTLLTLTDQREHTTIHHWNGQSPCFDPHQTIGFTYKVMVAVII